MTSLDTTSERPTATCSDRAQRQTAAAKRTSAQYERIVALLRLRHTRETGEKSWDAFVDWLTLRWPALRRSTVRLYRSAVMQVLRRDRPSDYAALVSRLYIDMNRTQPIPHRTLNRLAKSLPSHEWENLFHTLAKHRRSYWAQMSIQWLRWTICAGLRPVEWQTAALSAEDRSDEHCVLVVKNAKFDAVRAHGPNRSVHLRLSTAEQRELQNFLTALQSDYQRAYSGCRKSLQRAARELWPGKIRQPCLYTARHQFAADAKASGLQPASVAALMGHASPKTNQTHYGKRRRGLGDRLIAAPDPADVQRVRALESMKTEVLRHAVKYSPISL